MAVGEEGLVLHNLIGPAHHANHVVNGENIQRLFPPRVGDDAVFEALLLHEDGFGNLLEEVHHGGATEPEGGLGDAQLQGLPAVGAFEIGEEEQQLDLVAEIGGGQPLEAGQVQETELFRKGEVFLQQPVSPETAPRKREQAFVWFETNLAQRARRKNHALPGRRRQIARHDLNAIIAE